MSPGRTLYVIQGSDVSGAEIMHAPLMQADPDALLACPPGSATEEFARRLGVATVPLEHRALRVSGGRIDTLRSTGAGLRSAMALRRVLRNLPERRIVFCTSIRPALLASLAAIGLGRRVFWCVPDFLPRGPLRPLIRLLARGRAAGALALSEAIRSDFAGRSRRLRELVSVVYPGVDPEVFAGASDAGAPVGAIVGHISPTKRTDLAVDIAGLVAREVPGFRLRIVGRAQFREEDFALERDLRERVARDPALEGVVEFAGYATNVEEALRDCGLLLHCRGDEPFGIALIEAMALGLPVVAPAAAGPLEIVEDGVSGLLYPPGDADEAAKCIVRVVEDRPVARRIGEAARARVEGRFTLDRQLAETTALLERLDR